MTYDDELQNAREGNTILAAWVVYAAFILSLFVFSLV